MTEAASLIGTTIEIEVGAPASGGSCAARHDGRVVFVRHALPGELVRARVTDDRRGSYLRADAVEVLRASDDRVVAPCPYVGPGRCGGCDWQHATGAAQRAIKADVVREQFRRIARIDVSDLLSDVEELPGGLLGWRTRITYAADSAGRLGLHRHRSSDVERVERCLLGVDGVGDADALSMTWPGVTGVEVVRGAAGDPSVLVHRPGAGRQARGRRPPDRVELASGPAAVAVSVAGRPLSVSAGGFWQVHPAAVDTYAAALSGLLAPAPGDAVLELFSGAGALTTVLADAVGATGSVVAVEWNAAAVADARRNLADRPWVRVERARIDAAYLANAGRPDLVVLDPPRAGLGADVTGQLLALAPRAIGYVACDAATLARDVRVALDAGWRLAQLRAYDAFPMTAHVECIAHLAPPDTPTGPT